MPDLEIFNGPQEAAQEAEKQFYKTAETSINNKGFFTVVLSGGSTPANLYKLLSERAKASPKHSAILEKTHFFWGDERDVSPENSESNYGNFRKLLLSEISIPKDNIHRIKPEAGGPQEAAALYEKEIRRFFRLKDSQIPCFDMVFLGMGTDGHTASLFPGIEELKENKKLAVAVYIKTAGSFRITLTVPVFNNASFVIFLVTGANKAKILKEVIGGHNRPIAYPSQLILPRGGRLLWITDRVAAGLLDKNSDGG